MPQTLTTNRLILRTPIASDAADIVRAVNDVEVTQWLSQVPYPYSLSDAEAFIARQTSDKTFAICREEQLIGCIGTVGEFGYWLGRQHWGQGLMTEAAQAVLDWHFDTDGNDLISGHAVGNDRSRAVLRKMGFVDTEEVDRAHKITGKVRRQQKMVLTEALWRATGLRGTAQVNGLERKLSADNFGEKT